MQFRAAGKRIQVLAYRGYDKEKRRAVVKLLGSFDRKLYDVSVELSECLTDDEKKELQSYIITMRQSDVKAARSDELKYTATLLNRMCDSIDKGETDSQMLEKMTGAILEAASRLVRTLTPKSSPVKLKPPTTRKSKADGTAKA